MWSIFITNGLPIYALRDTCPSINNCITRDQKKSITIYKDIIKFSHLHLPLKNMLYHPYFDNSFFYIRLITDIIELHFFYYRLKIFACIYANGERKILNETVARSKIECVHCFSLISLPLVVSTALWFISRRARRNRAIPAKPAVSEFLWQTKSRVGDRRRTEREKEGH